MRRNQTDSLPEERQALPPRILPRITWNGEPASACLSHEQWEAIAFSLDLSHQQERIVRSIVDGLHEREIGQEMRISTYTVHSHVVRMYQKIGVASRTELMVRILLVVVAQGFRSNRARSKAEKHLDSEARAEPREA